MNARLRAQWFQQLALMVRQGIPLLRAMEILAEQHDPNRPEGRLLREICLKVSQGNRLSDTLAGQPSSFPLIAVALVRVGESGGGLVNVLEKIGSWLERERMMRQRLLSALLYPLFVLLVVFLLVILVLWGVVPSLAAILEELEAPIPWPTALLLQASDSLHHPLGALAWACGLVGILWMMQQYPRTPSGWRQLFSWGKGLPVLGTLIETDTLARYCDALHCCLSSGLDAVSAYRLAADVSGNPLLMDESAVLIEAIRDGETAAEAMTSVPEVYPSQLVYLIRTGEESGLLQRFLQVARDTFYLQVEACRASFLAALEPILMVCVSTLVGGLVLALLLPIQASLTRLLV